MKESEVRIGNWILVNGQEVQIWAIGDINLPRFDLNQDIGDLEASTFEPISLTEEWLIKFGFLNSENIWYFPTFEISENGRALRYETRHMRWGEGQKGYLIMGAWEGFNDVPINYVHELQNLYFALTGKELSYE